MVYFVSTSYGQQIRVFGVSPNLDSLMDEEVVNYKIDDPVNQDADSYSQGDIPFKNGPKNERTDGNDGKEYEKRIVELKDRIVLVCYVMILVQVPEKSMHDVFVHGPGNSFHEHGSNQNRDK